MKRLAFVALALVAALSAGCGTSSEVRKWFAADRTQLVAKTVPAQPIYVDVLGGGDLTSELSNEITRHMRKSRYLQLSLTADAPLILEVEPLDVYYGEDDPAFGPTIVWTTVVFRATLTPAGGEKPLLDGVIASYKGYEPADWDKLAKLGLRRAAVRDGVQKLIGLIETNTPKPGAEKKGGESSAAAPAPTPAPAPAAPQGGTGSQIHETGMQAGREIDRATKPLSDAVQPEPSSGKNPGPH
jgi:hypothetical protein